MLTVVCGMPAEQEIVQAIFPAGVVKLTGSAKLNLDNLVPKNCTKILSFGLSGGLSPKIKVADICIAAWLTNGQNDMAMPDPIWAHRLDELAGEATTERVGDIGSQYDVNPTPFRHLTCPWYSSGNLGEGDTVEQRATILARTGAWSIDDESYYVGKLAQNRRIPFAIVRSCSDDSSETLPLAARGAIMNSDGSANIEYLLKEIASEPFAQTLDLVKIAEDFNNSLASLREAGIALMPAFIN